MCAKKYHVNMYKNMDGETFEKILPKTEASDVSLKRSSFASVQDLYDNLGDLAYLDNIDSQLEEVKNEANTYSQSLVNSLNLIVNANTERITTAESNIESLNSETVELGNNINNLSTRVTTVEGNVGTVSTDLTSLTGRVSTLEGTTSSLGTRVTTAETNITTLDSEVSTFNTTVTEIKKDVSDGIDLVGTAITAKGSSVPTDPTFTDLYNGVMNIETGGGGGDTGEVITNLRLGKTSSIPWVKEVLWEDEMDLEAIAAKLGMKLALSEDDPTIGYSGFFYLEDDLTPSEVLEIEKHIGVSLRMNKYDDHIEIGDELEFYSGDKIYYLQNDDYFIFTNNTYANIYYYIKGADNRYYKDYYAWDANVTYKNNSIIYSRIYTNSDFGKCIEVPIGEDMTIRTIKNSNGEVISENIYNLRTVPKDFELTLDSGIHWLESDQGTYFTYTPDGIQFIPDTHNPMSLATLDFNILLFPMEPTVATESYLMQFTPGSYNLNSFTVVHETT